METVQKMYPLFKVGVDLHYANDYFKKLKEKCGFDECETSFELLTELIENMKIDLLLLPLNLIF